MDASVYDFDCPCSESATGICETCAPWGTLSTQESTGEGEDRVTVWAIIRWHLLAVLMVAQWNSSGEQLVLESTEYIDAIPDFSS